MTQSAMLDLGASSFLFVTCQVGAESTLKKEMQRLSPESKFAFSRPGFLTFKRSEPLPADHEVPLVFSRVYGASFGKLEDWSILIDAARAWEARLGRKPRLHVFARDTFAPGEEPLGHDPELWSRQAKEELSELSRQQGDAWPFLPEERAELGDPVVDVICVDEGERWLGSHFHSPGRWSDPGARVPLELPPEAPSRAYLKLEEGLLWSQAPLRAGDTAVEIGSAPGGASYALLQRGLRVVGIDPGRMDPRVLHHPRYEHISKPVNQVPRETLPDRIQWLLLDMNVSPSVSLFAVDRLATRMREHLLGVLLTLKLNQWKIADELPYMMEHLRAMGMVKLRATQLPRNRQEIFVYGLTRKGSAGVRPRKLSDR